MTNNIIAINRGDTFKFDIAIADASSETGLYTLKDDDVLYLGIMEPHQPFEFALIKKRYTTDNLNSDDNITVIIEPADTLDLLPGIYYYAVKLHKVSESTKISAESIDEVMTVINRTKFIIME